MRIEIVDHNGARHPLRYFLETPDLKILFLHDCSHIVEQLLAIMGSIEDHLIVLTRSWYLGEEHAALLCDAFANLLKRFPAQAAAIKNNLLWCFNSRGETLRFRAWCPEARSIFVNNACFLSERLFWPQGVTYTDKAIVNAKPLLFKRHYLSRDVPNRTFIGYNEDALRGTEGYVDIRRYAPDEMLWDIEEGEVARQIAGAACGLMLSEIEGACYASVETLLTGIPVVSTVSLGGRDSFYTSETATIVEPDCAAVAVAVAGWRARHRAGDVDGAAIRTATIARSRAFRAELVAAMAAAVPGPEYQALLDERLFNSNKLHGYRNFWVREIAAA